MTDVSTRYYLVQPPAGSQRDHLYGIAVKTLGDGNRYREIFELNKDRPQPDGGRLTDPMELVPGWALVLPADATGPDVRIGPLPGRPPAESDLAASDDSSQTAVVGYLLGIGALVATAVLIGVVLRILRRGGSAGEPEPAPPHARDPDARDPDARDPDARDPDARDPDARDPDARDPDARDPDARDPDARDPGTAEPAAPALRADGLDGLRATVHNGDDRLDVRLAGVEKAQHAYAWLDTPDGNDASFASPGGGLRLALGRSVHGVLCVDLACTPDVLTVTGPLDACRRQALALARQARGAGMGVTVVGEAIGRDEAPAGCRWTASFPEPEEMLDPRREGGGPSLVISCGLRGAQLRSARQLMARTDRLAVPVVIGEVLRARWSVEVTPGDGRSESGSGAEPVAASSRAPS